MPSFFELLSQDAEDDGDYDRNEPDFTDSVVIADFLAKTLDGIEFDADYALVMGSDDSAPDGDLRLTIERVIEAPYDNAPDIYTTLVEWRVTLTKVEKPSTPKEMGKGNGNE